MEEEPLPSLTPLPPLPPSPSISQSTLSASGLSPVDEVSLDISPHLLLLKRTAADLLGTLKPAPGSAQDLVDRRLVAALNAFGTAPSRAPQPIKPPPGQIPVELAREIEAFVQAWGEQMQVPIADAVGHPTNAAHPDADSEAQRLRHACDGLAKVLSPDARDALARHGVNLQNVALRTGLITLLLGAVHRVTNIYLRSAQAAAVGWVGMVISLVACAARLAVTTFKGESASVRSRVSEGIVLMGAIAGVVASNASGVGAQFASFMGTRVLTSVLRDVGNSQFELQNNTHGLSWRALAVSGTAWAAVNGLTTFVQSIYDAAYLAPSLAAADNTTLSTDVIGAGAAAAVPADVVVGAIAVGMTLYAVSECFDDWFQATTQRAVEVADFKTKAKQAIFNEEQYAEMLVAVKADAERLFNLDDRERQSAVDAAKGGYQERYQQFLRKKAAAGFSLTSREQGILDHTPKPGTTEAPSKLLAFAEGRDGDEAFKFDYAKLPSQLVALVEFYAGKHGTTLSTVETRNFARQFFTMIYIVQSGYVPKTALMRELEAELLGANPSLTPDSLRIAVAEALKNARQAAVEGIRIRIVRRTQGRLAAAGRALAINAARRNMVYTAAFGMVFANLLPAFSSPAADERSNELADSAQAAVSVFLWICVIYLFFYSMFHSDKQVSTPNQEGDIRQKSFHFDTAEDAASSDPATTRLEGVVAMDELMADVGLPLMRRGGMADFQPYVWNSECVFCDPPAPPALAATTVAQRVANSVAMYVSGNDPASRCVDVAGDGATFEGAVAHRSAVGKPQAMEVVVAQRDADKRQWACKQVLTHYDVAGLAMDFVLDEKGVERAVTLHALVARDKLDATVFYWAVFDTNQKGTLQATHMADALGELADAFEAKDCRLLLPRPMRKAPAGYPVRDFRQAPLLSSVRVENVSGSPLRPTLRSSEEARGPRDELDWGAVPQSGDRRLCHLRIAADASPVDAVLRMLEYNLRPHAGLPAASTVLPVRPASPPSVLDLIQAGGFTLATADFHFDAAHQAWTAAAMPSPLNSLDSVAVFFLDGKPKGTVRTAFTLSRSHRYESTFVLLHPAYEGRVDVVGTNAFEALVQALRTIGRTDDFQLAFDRPAHPATAPCTVPLERHPLVRAFARQQLPAFGAGGQLTGIGGVAKPQAKPAPQAIYRERQTAAECGICAANAMLRYLDPTCPLLQIAGVQTAVDGWKRNLGVAVERAAYVPLADIKTYLDGWRPGAPLAHVTLIRPSAAWLNAPILRGGLLPDFHNRGVVAVTYQKPSPNRGGLDHTVAIARDRVDAKVFHLLDSQMSSVPALRLESADMQEAVAAFCRSIKANVFEFLVPLAIDASASLLAKAAIAGGEQPMLEAGIEAVAHSAQEMTGGWEDAIAQAYWAVEPREPLAASNALPSAEAIRNRERQLERRRYVLLQGVDRAAKVKKRRLSAALAEEVHAAPAPPPSRNGGTRGANPTQPGGVSLGLAMPSSPDVLSFAWTPEIDPLRCIADSLMRFASGGRRHLERLPLPPAATDLASLVAAWPQLDANTRMHRLTIGPGALGAELADLEDLSMVALQADPTQPRDGLARRWLIVARDRKMPAHLHLLYPDDGMCAARDGASMRQVLGEVLADWAGDGYAANRVAVWVTALAAPTRPV